jgi:hypothetical protein
MGIAYNPKIVTDGLVLCLDAANVKSYPGSGIVWNNLVNQTLNTSLSNSPTFDNGGWIVFNGTNQLADTGIPGPTTFLPSSDFTLSVVVSIDSYPNINNASGTICGCFNFDGYGIFWDGSTTQVFIGAQMRARASNTLVERRREVDLGQWYHVTMSYSSSQNFMRLYLNNVLTDTTSSISGSYDVNLPANIRLAVNNVSRGANTGRFLPGRIAQCMIYSKALTGEEVQQNFNATRGRFGV